jgi:hypothetical protein
MDAENGIVAASVLSACLFGIVAIVLVMPSIGKK